MTTDAEALVLRAYQLAEGDVLDVRGFVDLFAEDSVFTGIAHIGVAAMFARAYRRTSRLQSRRPRPER